MQNLSTWTQDSLRSTENISYPNNDRILREQLHAELFKAKNPSKKQTTSCDHGKKLAMSQNWELEKCVRVVDTSWIYRLPLILYLTSDI